MKKQLAELHTANWTCIVFKSLQLKKYEPICIQFRFLVPQFTSYLDPLHYHLAGKIFEIDPDVKQAVTHWLYNGRISPTPSYTPRCHGVTNL